MRDTEGDVGGLYSRIATSGFISSRLRRESRHDKARLSFCDLVHTIALGKFPAVGVREISGGVFVSVMKHQHKSSSAEIARPDELLDEALKQTFPASDPIAINVELQ
jgi:hypothetical protein